MAAAAGDGQYHNGGHASSSVVDYRGVPQVQLPLEPYSSANQTSEALDRQPVPAMLDDGCCVKGGGSLCDEQRSLWSGASALEYACTCVERVLQRLRVADSAFGTQQHAEPGRVDAAAACSREYTGSVMDMLQQLQADRHARQQSFLQQRLKVHQSMLQQMAT